MKKTIFRLLMIIAFVIFMIWLCGNARAEVTEASYYTVASCMKESGQAICASGERLNDDLYTCASWDFSFGTLLRVHNRANGKSIVVRVNDRGPSRKLYKRGRRIDLSRSAFLRLAPLSKGVISVEFERVKDGI